jgi:hypothetical protein
MPRKHVKRDWAPDSQLRQIPFLDEVAEFDKELDAEEAAANEAADPIPLKGRGGPGRGGGRKFGSRNRMNKQSWFMFESLFPHISYQLLAFANIVPTHLIDRKGQLMYERDGSAKMGFLNLPPTVQFQALQLIFAYSLGKPPSFDGGGFDGAGGEDRFGYGAPQPRVGNLVFVHVEGFSKPEHKNDDGGYSPELSRPPKSDGSYGS